MDVPAAPDDLGAAGRRLWDGVHQADAGLVLVFRADELALLAEACHLADDLEAIRGELRGRPLLTEGSKGQEVADPLRAELHRTSQRLESLLRSLRIPDEVSGAGSELARRRWARG